MTDLAVVTQDPRFGGGARAQTLAFANAAIELGRRPTLLHPRFVPLVDSLAQLAEARRIAHTVRGAQSAWVVAAAAPYGYGALRSGQPYAAWVGTSLDEEWAARRADLALSRRLALELNAPLLRRLERRVLRGAQRIFATSPSSQSALAAAAGVPLEQVRILPIPVDTNVFHPEPDEEWLARLERPTVVFVGRADDPRKNAQLLLKAWPAVRTRIPEARLWLVGRRPAGMLPEGAQASGEVESVAAELRGGSLFVLPSRQEGFGVVVAEALSSGLPAVVTPCGGPEDLVRRSGAGTVLTDFEPGTLADGVVAALENRELLAAQRALGRSYIDVHHSRESFRAELAAVLAEGDDA